MSALRIKPLTFNPTAFILPISLLYIESFDLFNAKQIRYKEIKRTVHLSVL